jgi:acyl-coenzyme A thioesterase PaaI-like protein
VETTYTAPDYFQSYPGVLHGGIIATIIDEISGRSLMGDPDQPRFMFTAKIEVKYRKNVPLGKPLHIIGKTLKDHGHSAEAWAGIYDAESGELLAEGTTLLVNIPKDRVNTANLEEMGWKVYPDEAFQ